MSGILLFHVLNCYSDRTIAFVNRVKVPVMGFKVLAAGAIHPRDGIAVRLRP
jgi:hypothetical protein